MGKSYFCQMNKIKHYCHLFGPTSLYCLYTVNDSIEIEKFENYQKKSWRNKYQIMTANGVQTLSVPLVRGKNAQQLITDVKISYDENWIKNHLFAIKSAYGKSPYFDFYFPDIEMLLNKRHNYLFDLNIEALSQMLTRLGLACEITYTDSYDNNMEYLKPANVRFIKYPQVWEEKYNFTPNLSILDLLLCSGPEALVILKMMQFA